MIFENVIGPARPASWVLRFWPILLSSLLSGLAATALCKKIAIKLGVVDKPDNLVKTHKEPVAYLGGIGMLIGLTVGIFAGLYNIRNEQYFPDAFRWLLGILAGATIACVIGVIDDIFEIRPWQKILGQLVAASLIIIIGIRPAINWFFILFTFKLSDNIEFLFGVAFIIISVLGATNSLNLLDGLDGLCAGVTIIITVAMLLIGIHLSTWDFSVVGDPVVIIICLSLLGAVLGFLPFNRHPAKIFMGDAGSMLLGFIIASIMVIFAEKIPRWWMASIIIFGLPILDTAVALARRLLNKRPLFVSDRGHIYDQMIDRGISLKKTVIICYLITGLYGLLGVIMSQIRTRYAAIVYIFVISISALFVVKKGFLKMQGIRGAIKKNLG
ncbi:MAG: MraY family glycosyltransferase [Planctomycetota bacterium]